MPHNNDITKIVINRALSDCKGALLSSPNLNAGPINQISNAKMIKPKAEMTILFLKKAMIFFIKYSDNFLNYLLITT